MNASESAPSTEDADHDGKSSNADQRNWEPLPLRPMLPEIVPPEGLGWMTLFHAVLWIATGGGNKAFDPADVVVWREAYDQLLSAISSKGIAVTGMRGTQRESLEAHLFAGLAIHYPFEPEPLDLLLSEEVYLSSSPYLDDNHWRHGCDDSLQNRHRVTWSKLLVARLDVARLWPFHPNKLEREVERTGAPGQPSSAHLVEPEHLARCERGEAKPGLRDEAKELSAWLEKAHPSAHPMTHKTIENRIRKSHREYAAKTRN